MIINGNQSSNGEINPGAAYVFERTGNTWAQQAYIKPSINEENHYFGTNLAISGNRLIVGAPGAFSEAGAAFIYHRIGTQWSEETFLRPTVTDAFDTFGGAVDIHGDYALIGANAEWGSSAGINGNATDNSFFEAGAAYIFSRSGGTWTQDAYIKSSNPAEGDFFGTSVSLEAGIAVIGAVGESSGIIGDESDNSRSFAGAAYVFEQSGGSWAQTRYLKALNPDAGDGFGRADGYSGEKLIIGAGSEAGDANTVDGIPNDNAGAAGAAYIAELYPPGVEYCHPAVPNSTGSPAMLTSSGSSLAIDNDVTLRVIWLPTLQLGYYLKSPGQDFVPGAGGSDGNLCVGGGSPIGRHNRPGEILFTGAVSAFEFSPNLTDLPTPMGSHTVLAGETWNFQAWYRDAAPAGSNFTNAVSITFQ